MSPINNPQTPAEQNPSNTAAEKAKDSAQSKETRSPMTVEQLRALRHEVEQGKISKKADEYNFPDTKLEKTDSLADILEKVFTQKGAKAPKGGIQRIELALTAQGLDLEKLNAGFWKVEKGVLIFGRDENGKKVEVFKIDLLPWASLESKEKAETLVDHNYNLGVYTGSPDVNITPDTVEGSVDATRHGVAVQKPKWYEEKVHAAALMMKIYDSNRGRFDAATQKLIAERETILRDLASQTDYSPQKMRADFEKQYTKDEICGGEGVYNFVLAFQRVLDAYGEKDSWLTKPDVNTVVTLVIGKTLRSRDERYVKAVISHEKPVPPEPVPPIPPVPPEDKEKEDNYRDRTAEEKEHMVVGTDAGHLLPSSAEFKRNVDVDVASNALLESYSKSGTRALVEGLKAIPEEQRKVVLDAIFGKLNEKDPHKAFDLMKDIIKEKRGEQESAVYEGLKENMEKAPDENTKNFWQIQMLLFETSQAGDIDETTGKPHLTMEQSQEKMRQVMELVGKVDGDKLPDELKEMFKQQKQYFETSMRQGIAADYVETAMRTVEASMKNMKDKDTYIETSFESLKKMSRAKIKDELNATFGLDNDSEVYMSSMHVLEAVRLAVTYQYPQDVAAGKKIENPIEHYFNEIKNGTLTEIKLPEGASAEMKDVLVDDPIVSTGKLDLNQLFVDKTKEFDLFDQYQKGEERLGEDSFWNMVQEYKESAFGGNKTAAKVASYATLLLPFPPIAALSQLASDEQLSFMENSGGFTEGSKMFFPKDGDLSAFMKDVPGGGEEDYAELGATEKLQMYKILQLISMKNYDEARALCIEAVRHRLEAKKKLNENDIKDKAYELQKEYGEKISAQVRIQLEEQKITNAVLQEKKIPRTGGGYYSDLTDYINDRVKGAIEEMAYIRLQGEVAESFSDAEVAGFSQYEKSAYEKLQYLNGHGLKALYSTAENRDVVRTAAVMLAEIILIELATLGAGAYLAGAVGATRVGAITAGAGVNLSRGSRFTEAVRTAGATGRLAGRLAPGATGFGGYAGRGIRYVAEGQTVPARFAGHYLHGAAFVEMQSLMNGRPANPISVDGQVQIASVAATMYGLGKLQQFTRGATTGARMAEAGTLTGWRALPGVRNLNQLSAFLGRRTHALDTGTSLASKVGSKAFTAGEWGVEIAALHQLGALEQELAVWTGTMTEDEKKAMYEPDAFKRYAHTAGVVLGLRTWRVAKQGPKPPPQPPVGPKPPPQLPIGPKPPPQLPVGAKAPKRLPRGVEPKGLLPERFAEPLSVRESAILQTRIREYRQMTEAQRGEVIKRLDSTSDAIKQGIYGKAEIESIFKKVFDLPPQTKITEQNWNKLTRNTFIRVHPDKVNEAGTFKALQRFATEAKIRLLP